MSVWALALCVLSTVCLFLGFYRNHWKTADQGWFDTFQWEPECLVLGRLVKSRQDGILSSGGLTGLGEGRGSGWEPVSRDFDGDDRADLAIYGASRGHWLILESSTSYTDYTHQKSWGGTGWQAVPGDYDGDHKADPAVYASASAEWWILTSSTDYRDHIHRSGWGGPDWTPVPADYDGDGKADLAVYGADSAEWWVLASNSDYRDHIYRSGWGGVDWTPVPADYDGDGKADLAVYGAASAEWWVLTSGSDYTDHIYRSGWGGADWIPVPADYDGDGKADLGVYGPDSGDWWILESHSGYGSHFHRPGWGGIDWEPVTGDFDGDGRDDLVVYNTASGEWWILESHSEYTTRYYRDGCGGSSEMALTIDDEDLDFQYEAYVESLSFERFFTYKSQIGFQAMAFGVLDRVTGFTPRENIRIFKALTSLLSAFALTFLVAWFFQQFGLFVSCVVLLTSILSQWLTVFGRNMWWSLWAFYLPMITVISLSAKEQRDKRYSDKLSALCIFVAVFVKCLFNGYEYITTTLLMMVVPFVYYAVWDEWGIHAFVKRLGMAGLVSVSSILVSQVILAFQIAAVDGGLMSGLQHIITALSSRTYADPSRFPADYEQSLSSSVATVLVAYLRGMAIDLRSLLPADAPWLPQTLRISFLQLIIAFALCTFVCFISQKPTANWSGGRRKVLALIAATWFSILAPLSWFVVFKAHSYIHTHVNYVTWHMPFTMFGFGLCGLVARDAVSAIRESLGHCGRWAASVH